VARFTGRSRNITAYLRHVAQEIRHRLAALGVRRLADVIGRRDLLEKRTDLQGKAALADVGHLVSAPPQHVRERHLLKQTQLHTPPPRVSETEAAERAIAGEVVEVATRLTNIDRCVGVSAAGHVARRFGDAGLPKGKLVMRHKGAAGHFYAAYSLSGMEFYVQGLVADSGFTAAYGGKVVVVPENGNGNGRPLTVVGNTFGYGARAGRAYIRGRAGNRFGICLRRSHEGDGPRIVVEGVEANAFQYMTGGTALVIGPTGFNLGSGMTGGVVYLLDPDESVLNRQYVQASTLREVDIPVVRSLLDEHLAETKSPAADALLAGFDPGRFTRVSTCLAPEPLE
jgi:glutamate synthase domain-containing protein 3